MAIFSCVNCGGAITVANDRVDHDVICPECHTRQAVPAEVRPVALMPHPIERPHRVMGERAKVPEYALATLVAVLLSFAGWITIVVGIIAAISVSNVLLGVMVVGSGVTTVAIALILRFARQIARQTYQASLDM